MKSTDNFTDFVADFFSSECRWNPAWATEAGLHTYDPESPDRSEAAYDRRIEEMEALTKRAGRLSRKPPDAQAGIDLELITGRLRAESMKLRSLQSWRKNPIDYLWTAGRGLDSLMQRDFAPPRERLRSLTSRLRALPDLLQSMMSNVANPPAEFAQVSLRLARGTASFVSEGVDRWARAAAGDQPDVLAEFRSAHTRAVAEFERTIAWLSTLPRVPNAGYAIGRDALTRMLEYEEMTDTSLDTLLEVATTNLDRDYRHFLEVAARVDPDCAPADVIFSLSNDCPRAGQLLAWAASTVDRVRGFLGTHPLVTLPPIPPPTITETPAYYRFGAFAAMNSPGAYEQASRQAFYYVTPPEADWDDAHRDAHLRLFNRPVLDIITIHETYPGHFLQFANAHRFPTHTRKLLSCGSNVEGWAHYVEQMMVEEGYGEGDLRIRLAQLLEALVRDCRFVVAIGLHTGTMDVEAGARLFETKAFMEPDNALEEARRGTFDPTYLVYTLGKLQIFKLRDDWEARFGSRNLRGFHDAFLQEGGAPIRILRRRMLGALDGGAALYPASAYTEGTGRR